VNIFNERCGYVIFFLLGFFVVGSNPTCAEKHGSSAGRAKVLEITISTVQYIAIRFLPSISNGNPFCAGKKPT